MTFQDPDFIRVWVGRGFMPERHGQACRITRRVRAGTVEIAFRDGHTQQVESHLVRRRRGRA